MKTYCRNIKSDWRLDGIKINGVYEYHIVTIFENEYKIISFVNVDDDGDCYDDVRMTKTKETGELNMVMFNDYFEEATEEDYVIRMEAEKFNF